MHPFIGVVIFLTIHAFLLSFYGPVFDHHFAEREPAHEHIYLGRISLKHIHPYEVLHAHPKAHPNETSHIDGSSSTDVPSDEIVFLAAHDAMDEVITQLTAPTVNVALNFPGLDKNHYAFVVPGDDVFPQSAFIALPKLPPRYSSFLPTDCGSFAAESFNLKGGHTCDFYS